MWLSMKPHAKHYHTAMAFITRGCLIFLHVSILFLKDRMETEYFLARLELSWRRTEVLALLGCWGLRPCAAAFGA